MFTSCEVLMFFPLHCFYFHLRSSVTLREGLHLLPSVWRSTEVMQHCIPSPSLSLHTLVMSLTLTPSPPPTFPECFTAVEIKLALQKWQRVVTATRHHNSFPKWRKPPLSPRFIIWSCVCGMLGNINTTKYNCYNFPVSPQPALNTRSSVSKLKKKSLSLRTALWL